MVRRRRDWLNNSRFAPNGIMVSRMLHHVSSRTESCNSLSYRGRLASSIQVHLAVPPFFRNTVLYAIEGVFARKPDVVEQSNVFIMQSFASCLKGLFALQLRMVAKQNKNMTN